MSTKGIILGCALMACGVSANAQIEYSPATSLYDLAPGTKMDQWLLEEKLNGRVGGPSAADTEGTGEITIEESVRGYYLDAYKALQLGDTLTALAAYEKMHGLWWDVFSKAPMLITVENGYIYLYHYPQQVMFPFLISNEVDPIKRLGYFRDQEISWRTRIANLDKINAMQSKETNVKSLGYVMCNYAYYHYVYGGMAVKDTDMALDMEKSYELFLRGIKQFQQETASDLEFYVLDAYIRCSSDLYKVKPDEHRAQFLEDYLDCREVCEKMLEAAKEEGISEEQAREIVKKYDPVLQTCDVLLMNSGAAQPEQILAFYEPKIEQNKTNLSFLKSALTLMAENDCDSFELYYRTAEYAYQLEPTYESAIATAKRFAAQGDETASLHRYAEAIELAHSDKAKGSIALKIAKSLSKSNAELKLIYGYLDKAVEYDPSLEGQVAYTRAQCYTNQHLYDQAIAACDYAASCDITVEGPAMRLKERIQTAQANYELAMQKNAEARAAYEAYKRKKQEEEDFWTKGKK